jgi:hypothetical protein
LLSPGIEMQDSPSLAEASESCRRSLSSEACARCPRFLHNGPFLPAFLLKITHTTGFHQPMLCSWAANHLQVLPVTQRSCVICLLKSHCICTAATFPPRLIHGNFKSKRRARATWSTSGATIASLDRAAGTLAAQPCGNRTAFRERGSQLALL